MPAQERPPFILVEAESFQQLGGWVIDQQFMDQMGSPYVLAHGLGVPVADAVTTVESSVGHWRIWVRTCDWVAPWYRSPAPEEAPGRFQVLIGGHAVPTLFGTEGAGWHWQVGGMVELPAGQASIALHDLTGFEGRCDALLFARDPDFVPPNEPAALATFRRAALDLPAEPSDGGEFDLVVVGGGIAGSCAAIAAARMGLLVALVQDRPVVGGNASFEVAVNPAGNVHLEPFPRLGDVVRELEPNHRMLGPQAENIAQIRSHDPRTDAVRAEPGLTLLAGWRVIGAATGPEGIESIVAQEVTTGRRLRLRGRWFADCTGDGELGCLAGADHDMTLTGHLGPTNCWRTVDTGEPAPFPRCPWAIDLTDKPFPGRGDHVGQWGGLGLKSLGGWFWESGFDLHPITEVEQMRDTNFRAMYGAWDALKNVDGQYPDHQLAWAAYVTGKRESRRLFGDVIVSRKDLFQETRYPDGCVPCTWHMDLHVPHQEYQKGFEGEEFISWCVQGPFPRPFWLPFRALYSRNIANLFMAGRDVSVTHEALGAVRVMRTTGMMGEVVGLAAALCRRHGCSPRDLYEQHLDELTALLKAGVPGRTQRDVSAP